jgi:hypothetical protein
MKPKKSYFEEMLLKEEENESISDIEPPPPSRSVFQVKHLDEFNSNGLAIPDIHLRNYDEDSSSK